MSELPKKGIWSIANLWSAPPAAILDKVIWFRPVPSPMIRIIFFGLVAEPKDAISRLFVSSEPIAIYSTFS